jgi:hypothetical protein
MYKTYKFRKRKIPFDNNPANHDNIEKMKHDDIVKTKHNDMEKHVTNSIHYFENLQKQLDAHATKASHIALRKSWLDNQKKINYTNEYDRIRSQIAHNVVKGHSIQSLNKRHTDLLNLGAQSINGIN